MEAIAVFVELSVLIAREAGSETRRAPSCLRGPVECAKTMASKESSRDMSRFHCQSLKITSASLDTA